jgi:hypothetical protein
LAEILFYCHREGRSNSKRHKELTLGFEPRSKGSAVRWCGATFQALGANLNIFDKRAGAWGSMPCHAMPCPIRTEADGWKKSKFLHQRMKQASSPFLFGPNTVQYCSLYRPHARHHLSLNCCSAHVMVLAFITGSASP